METIIAAIIAAIVTIIGAVISFYTNRWSVRSELRKVELELNRKLTEKLYDKRLDTYPIAFEITDGLLGEHLFSSATTKEYLQNIYDQLMEWHRTKGIVLSDESITRFQQLRKALAKIIKADEALSEDALRPLWFAKNEFRASMRKDLHLLYNEEQEDDDQKKNKK
jgi:hypothetical protein